MYRMFMMNVPLADSFVFALLRYPVEKWKESRAISAGAANITMTIMLNPMK